MGLRVVSAGSRGIPASERAASATGLQRGLRRSSQGHLHPGEEKEEGEEDEEEEKEEEEEEEEGQKRSMDAFVFGILDERSGTVAGAKAFGVLLGCFPTGCWRVLPRSSS